MGPAGENRPPLAGYPVVPEAVVRPVETSCGALSEQDRTAMQGAAPQARQRRDKVGPGNAHARGHLPGRGPEEAESPETGPAAGSERKRALPRTGKQLGTIAPYDAKVSNNPASGSVEQDGPRPGRNCGYHQPYSGKDRFLSQRSGRAVAVLHDGWDPGPGQIDN